MEDKKAKERKAKQLFLKENVLDMGYSPQEFHDYATEYKEDGANIDNWTKDELEVFVLEFQKVMKLRKPSSLRRQDSRKSASGSKEHQPEEETKKEHEESKEKEKIQVKFVERAQMSSLNNISSLDFKITDYENKVSGLFGLGKHTMYFTVRTLPLDFKVKRKFSEFLWLRDTMVKLYPGYYIPPLFKKKKSKNASELFVVKRMKYLENFLKSLAKSQDLLACKYLEEFLKNDESKSFSLIQKEADSLSKIDSLSAISNLDGKIEMAFNKEQKKFFHYFNEFCQKADPIYRDIRVKSKKLNLDFDQAFETINSIGNSFAQLNTIATQFNEYNEEPYKFPDMQENYLKLNNMMMNWGDIMAQQLGVIEDHFCSFFKFYNQELESYKQVMKFRESTYQEFIHSKIRLDNKKERAFNSYDPSKWDIEGKANMNMKELAANKEEALRLMYPKETAVCNDFKGFFMYVNYKSLCEVQRALSARIDSCMKNFKEFCTCQNVLTNDNMHLWDDGNRMFEKNKPEEFKEMHIKSQRPSLYHNLKKELKFIDED